MPGLTGLSALPLQLEKTDKKKREARMPLSKYFKGDGEKVMGAMKDRYGADKGKQVFYATANKRGMAPADDKSKGAKPKRKTLGQRLAGG